MKIKCTEYEREWLIKHLGEEIAENYPWNAYPSDESIAVELEYLILREGLTSLDEDGMYNDFGHECQAIHDSLYYQNVPECKADKNGRPQEAFNIPEVSGIEIKNCLVNGKVGKTQTNDKGETSILFYDNKIKVSVNPVKQIVIQINRIGDEKHEN